MGRSRQSSTDCIEAIADAIAGLTPTIRRVFETHRAVDGSENPSGERVLEADIRVDELLEDHLGSIESVGTYASEERANPVDTGDGYAVAVDPLDGSSNLGSNNSVGTIVGVYDEPLPASGRSLVGAMYVLYGPATTAMIADEHGVSEFLFSEGGREVLTEDVTLPATGGVYGFGGPVPEWSSAFRRYALSIQRRLKRRYGGALVADVNQVLSKGGVFAYPSLESRPDGKLRLQFEGNPIAYIVEQAGGRSFDGEGPVLDREASRLHGRTPLFVGSTEPIARLLATFDDRLRGPDVTTWQSPWPIGDR